MASENSTRSVISAAMSETTNLHPLIFESFAMNPAATGLDLATEVIVNMPGACVSEYFGTRAALEVEGLIPEGLTWPNGLNAHEWEDGLHRYFLRRCWPAGVKGPRKLFLEVDWWGLFIGPRRSHKSYVEQAIREKALADEIYRRSDEGVREWAEMHRRLCESHKDAAFQARIPGLVLPRRCRKAVRRG